MTCSAAGRAGGPLLFDRSGVVSRARAFEAKPVGGELLLGALLLWRGAVRARSRSGGLSSGR